MRAPKDRHLEPVSPTEAEVIAFRAAIADDPLWALFETAIETGMRFSELAALRWELVDLKRVTITVRENVSRDEDAQRIVGTPKSRRGTRVLSLSSDLVEILRRITR